MTSRVGRTGRDDRRGFSLIELLTVVMIISMLAGLMAVLVAAVRARASRAKAQTEVRELARAWKAYWMVYQKWPPGLSGGSRAMDSTALAVLQGNNPQRIVFMEWDPNREFKDPWGNPYYVDFSRSLTVGQQDYQTVVRMSLRQRFQYEY